MPPTPSIPLLSASEAKERLREIVEGFFFRRLGTEDGKRIRSLLVKSLPGWGRGERHAVNRPRAADKGAQKAAETGQISDSGLRSYKAN